jgi:hypothetical protein
MSIEKDDGGPAYPTGGITVGQNEILFSGLSIRDWFAGQALASGQYKECDEYAMAEQCYIAADAMLKERAQ